jgi:hypothetical protein
LNAGLTQVLDDGDNSYLYGVGRISQVNTGNEYFLGDALGSVRQLTNASGAVTLAFIRVSRRLIPRSNHVIIFSRLKC